MIEKDTSCIPKGTYCYNIVAIYDDANNGKKIKTAYCPYYSTQVRNGVVIPYCEYLEEFSLPADLPDEDYKKTSCLLWRLC